MSEVTRYDLNEDVSTGEMFISPVPESMEGRYVAYKDYAELKAQRDALAAENAALRKFGDTLSDMHNNLNGEGTGIQGRAEVACQQVALEAALEEFDAIQTPATDAYLNSVRADAVASFAHHQRVIADSETDPTIKRGHRISAGRAEDFAAQLRAGEPS